MGNLVLQTIDELDAGRVNTLQGTLDSKPLVVWLGADLVRRWMEDGLSHPPLPEVTKAVEMAHAAGRSTLVGLHPTGHPKMLLIALDAADVS